MSSAEQIAVLDIDPDLAADLDGAALAEARAQARAGVRRYPRGALTLDPSEFDGRGFLGLLITDGLLVRKVSVGSRACAELLGPGDLLQPWLSVGVDASVCVEVDWEVGSPTTVAVLDRAFAAAVAPWPEIATTITGRVMARSHWVAFQLAVCHVRSVRDRLLLVLWHIADRWGRVTPRGVEISIALPHWLLGYMIGARRPAVTLGLRELQDSGTVRRLARSRFALCGDPPAAYHTIHARAGHRDTDPCDRAR